MKKVFEGYVEFFNKFASGNDVNTANGKNYKPHIYRGSKYNLQKAQAANRFFELAEYVDFQPTDGAAYYLRELYQYPVPKSLVASKKKREAFDPQALLPVTRGTLDIDNSSKPMHDALSQGLGIDDSQIVSVSAHKRYWLNDTYRYTVELYEMPSGVEIEFYE